MTVLELPFLASPEDALLAYANENQLEIKTMALRSLPGAKHWHLKKPKTRGTLEATWDVKRNRFWLSAHHNRQAEWVEKAFTDLEARFARQVCESHP